MESWFFVFLLSLKTWLDTPLRRRAVVLCWLLLVPLLGWSMAGRAAEGDLFRSEPIIKPEVERRDIHTAKIDTEDFELGFFGGLYSTGDFGTNSVTGARLAFHINESLFVEAAAGSTKTDTTSVETFFPTVFSLVNDRTLTYYNISLGWPVEERTLFQNRPSGSILFLLEVASGMGTWVYSSFQKPTSMLVRPVIPAWTALWPRRRQNAESRGLAGMLRIV